jgi:hypothetical protein
VPQSAKPDATTFPLGAHVRLRRGQAKATGVVIGNSTDIDRIQVQWDGGIIRQLYLKSLN